MMRKPFFRSCVAGLLMAALMNSWYFNSTGRLLDKARYEARANTADLKISPNPVVYTNGTEYYIELPRYRYGKPVRLQYDLSEQSQEPVSEKRGMGLFRIPADYAQYLTGQGKGSKEPLFLEEVPDAALVKTQCRALPVVKPAGEKMVTYTYESPNAGLIRLAAPFNWLLVDLPVTVLENGVIIAAFAGVLYLAMEDDDCDDDWDDHHHHRHHRHHRKHRQHHRHH